MPVASGPDPVAPVVLGLPISGAETHVVPADRGRSICVPVHGGLLGVLPGTSGGRNEEADGVEGFSLPV